MNILDIEMQPNDAKAKTVRDYLKALLSNLWRKEESFSGKRPFGNSGWQHDVYAALVRAGAIKGALDEDGYPFDIDYAAGEAAVLEAIEAL